MACCVVSPIPTISISPAPPEEPIVEPYSPFSPLSWKSLTPSDDENFRPQHLSPPPTIASFKNLSPLRPAEQTVSVKGLERERFEALLQGVRERNTAVGVKKAQDLRREIAMKAHKNKQVERRALFLSKVMAPPSPTATLTPKTPPDSPAIFHYTLPSPGLVSPLSMFEALGSGDPELGSFVFPPEPWVEQVDFRLPEGERKLKEAPNRPALNSVSQNIDTRKHGKRGRALPSLDQITARLSSQRRTSPPPAEGDENHRSSMRLPAFLRTQAVPDSPLPASPKISSSIGISRLQRSLRSASASSPHNETDTETVCMAPPKSPVSPRLPKLQVTTLVVPRTPTISPIDLTKANLSALNSNREQSSKDMLSTLKRRMSPPIEDDLTVHVGERVRRHSSPADLHQRRRAGFEHPVLSLPGGF
jgi:hypothetical protein